jgi:ubiquinone/menaquinone biosynthesis C-methylase UbiE
VRISLGGEGDSAGYINVNSLEGNIRTAAQIKARGPLVLGRAEKLPFPDRSVSEIVTNLPGTVWGRQTEAIISEMQRVLAPGGKIRATCLQPIFTEGNPIRSTFEKSGFVILDPRTAVFLR